MPKVDLLCRSAKMDNTQFNELNPQLTTDGVDQPPVEIAVCINSEHKSLLNNCSPSCILLVFPMYFYCDVCFVFVQVSTLQAIRTNCFSLQLLFPSCVCLSPGIDTKTHLSLFKSKGLEHGLKAGLQVQVQVHIQAEIQVGRSVKSKSEQFINEEWFLQCLWHIQFQGKFSCCLDTKGISILCRLTRVGWSKFGLSSACQPRIPFDGKYVYWAYPSEWLV